jgi:hypothetical protein
VGRLDSKALYRHACGAVLWAQVQGDFAVSLVVEEGLEALNTQIEHAFKLPDAVRLRLRHHLRPGTAGPGDLNRALGEHDVVTPLFGVLSGDQELRLCRLETRGVHRTVVLALLITEDRITGFRVLEGAAVLEQLVILSEAGPLFDGPEGTIDDLRQEAAASAEAIAEGVGPLLVGLATGLVDIQAIRPRPSDYAKVFQGVELDRVRLAYDRLWEKDPPRIRPGRNQTELAVQVTTGGALATDHELSSGFSDHYRDIADHLVSDRTWLAWSYRRPGEDSGLSFEGLVWLGDRWAWFPKAWRVILRR